MVAHCLNQVAMAYIGLARSIVNQKFTIYITNLLASTRRTLIISTTDIRFAASPGEFLTARISPKFTLTAIRNFPEVKTLMITLSQVGG